MKVSELAEFIIENWDDWDGEAQQIAQISQGSNGWHEFVRSKLLEAISALDREFPKKTEK